MEEQRHKQPDSQEDDDGRLFSPLYVVLGILLLLATMAAYIFNVTRGHR